MLLDTNYMLILSTIFLFEIYSNVWSNFVRINIKNIDIKPV
jgi:hypothetical protein